MAVGESAALETNKEDILMAKKGFIPQKIRPWIEARKTFRLSHAQIQMARELGLNPKKFGSLANNKQESWKAPLPDFIERIYEKRFGKSQPDDIRSIELKLKEKEKIKEEKKAMKQALAKSSTISHNDMVEKNAKQSQ